MLFIDQNIGEHGHSHGGATETDSHHSHSHGHGHGCANAQNNQCASKSNVSHEPMIEHSLAESNSHAPLPKSAAVILTIGLSVHNTLEGISIGLSPTQEKLIVIMIGVCTHKLIDSFFLGMMFMRSNWLDRSGYLIMFLFSLSGPVGVAIGFLLQNGAPVIVQGVMTSLTTGTFLYIAMTEIMPKEFSNEKNKLYKLFGFILGLTLFAIFI